jgi:lipopolysaccharide export system protein LptC
MTRVLRIGWEKVSIYLPILLMGVLALGTYWLVRSSPNFEAIASKRELRHEHDYLMRQFSVRSFEKDGSLKMELTGEEAKHFPDTDTLEIEQINIKNLNEVGRISTAKANRAVVNGDTTEVQLIGDAIVIREGGKEKSGYFSPQISIRSEFLHAYLETEVVKSHKSVEIHRGNSTFTANSIEFNNFEQVLNLKGRVRGTLFQQDEK